MCPLSRLVDKDRQSGSEVDEMEAEPQIPNLSVVTQARLLEYEKLKDEQSRRIHFRDNLRYVALVAAALVGSYASSKPEHTQAWLLIPMLSSILGWTYIMNMVQVEKISLYTKKRLRPALGSRRIFGWEEFRSTGPSYCVRKAFQIAIDWLTFVVPAALGLTFFAFSDVDKPLWIWFAFAADSFLAFWILCSIYVFSDSRAQIPHRLAGWIRARHRRASARKAPFGAITPAKP
jgi:hypothetical protein